MTTQLYPSFVDEQLAEIERSLALIGFGLPCEETIAKLPEHMAVPSGRVLMVFKGATMWEAMQSAERAHIENPQAWSKRACLCGEWTVAYMVKA
ncbi:hypothetical protein [Pseudomonas gregormendelii]